MSFEERSCRLLSTMHYKYKYERKKEKSHPRTMDYFYLRAASGLIEFGPLCCNPLSMY